jgi:hypothetical protein
VNFYRLAGPERKRFLKRTQDSFGGRRNHTYAGSMQSVIGDYFGAQQRT